MSNPNFKHPLVQHLVSIAKSQDRGALAALRSGVGKSPGEASRMFPYVAPYLKGDSPKSSAVQAVFLTASLFASHPVDCNEGNLGTSLRQAVESKHGEGGVETRLVAAIDADPEDLPRFLTGLVSLCESASVPINWTAFYWDTFHLLDPDEGKRDRVRLAWARAFWVPAKATDSPVEEIAS